MPSRELGCYFTYPYLDAAVPGFVSHLFDVDERPLAEFNAPEALKEGVLFVYKDCIYGGGRAGGRMNVTALKQTAECWDEMLADLIRLRGIFMRRYPIAMNYLLLSRFANFLTSLPGFLMRRGVLRWNGIPRSLSSLYKTSQGLYITANDAILRGGLAAAFEPVTTEAFLAHTDEHQTFWVRDRVCSGPPALVRRFVELVVDGGSETGETWLDAHLRDGAALDYAELKLRAQFARRVFEAWVDDALAAVAGSLESPRAPSLEDLNRQCGLNLDAALVAAPRIADEELELLLVPCDPPARERAQRVSQRFVPIQLHYAAYLRVLQGQIAAVLGRASLPPFQYCAYQATVDAFETDSRQRVLKGLIDTERLAGLIDRALAA
jgi:hypothetical protein